MKIHAILGAGQVAQAIEANLKDGARMFDVGEWEGKSFINFDYLHIAIPYNDKFIDIVNQAKKVFKSTITIIHSTVKPGTSRALDCCYSPVVGRHDNDLKAQLNLFNKFIACPAHWFEAIDDEFRIDMTYCWSDTKDSLEYAKIMSTTRMYWDLLFQKYMQADCEKNGYNFEDVYSNWTRNYNNGTTIEHPEWARPIYDKMETDLPGGHCLRPNIRLVDNEITRILKEYECLVLQS